MTNNVFWTGSKNTTTQQKDNIKPLPGPGIIPKDLSYCCPMYKETTKYVAENVCNQGIHVIPNQVREFS